MTQTSPPEAPLLVHGRTWEDMPVGSAFRTAKRTITETDLVTFLHVSGINEPLFYDAYERNRATGAFVLIDENTYDTVAAGTILAR